MCVCACVRPRMNTGRMRERERERERETERERQRERDRERDLSTAASGSAACTAAKTPDRPAIAIIRSSFFFYDTFFNTNAHLSRPLNTNAHMSRPFTRHVPFSANTRHPYRCFRFWRSCVTRTLTLPQTTLHNTTLN